MRLLILLTLLLNFSKAEISNSLSLSTKVVEVNSKYVVVETESTKQKFKIKADGLKLGDHYSLQVKTQYEPYFNVKISEDIMNKYPETKMEYVKAILELQYESQKVFAIEENDDSNSVVKFFMHLIETGFAYAANPTHCYYAGHKISMSTRSNGEPYCSKRAGGIKTCQTDGQSGIQCNPKLFGLNQGKELCAAVIDDNYANLTKDCYDKASELETFKDLDSSDLATLLTDASATCVEWKKYWDESTASYKESKLNAVNGICQKFEQVLDNVARSADVTDLDNFALKFKADNEGEIRAIISDCEFAEVEKNCTDNNGVCSFAVTCNAALIGDIGTVNIGGVRNRKTQNHIIRSLAACSCDQKDIDACIRQSLTNENVDGLNIKHDDEAIQTINDRS